MAQQQPRVLTIEPEDVDTLIMSNFRTDYHSYVEDIGLNRDGTPPAFTWQARPDLFIHVNGFPVTA